MNTVPEKISFEEFRQQFADSQTTVSELELAKQYLAKYEDSPDLQASLELQLLAGRGQAKRLSGENVVVLIHGIRTFANWQQVVQEELAIIDPNIIVYPVRYGVFDLFSFICPIFTRRKPIARVERELRFAQKKHPHADVSVIAHSFGTYIVSRLLKRMKDLSLTRLILCGSIIPEDYNWPKVVGKVKGTVLNDVGTEDILPLVAKHGSIGYGPSGRNGFGSVAVQDRFFKLGHSDFFKRDHIRGFWAPFLSRGQVVPSKWGSTRPTPSAWEGIANWFPVKSVIVGCAVYFTYGAEIAQHWLWLRSTALSLLTRL